MQNKELLKIFKGGSKTFFNSSLFFPETVLNDVIRLYAFVRTVDDFVDSVPVKKEEYFNFKKKYLNHIKGDETDNVVIKSFVELKNQKNFDESWVEAFFNSMEMDIQGRIYYKFEDIEDYVYGSAEVIGLFMCKIFALSHTSYDSAKIFGKALQYINFVRDVVEDIDLKRVYFPENELERFGILRPDFLTTKFDLEQFSKFMRFQVKRCFYLLENGERGLPLIPRRLRLPVKTASDMYKWTLSVIDKRPEVVLEKKIRPSRPFLFYRVFSNIFNSNF
ncbi:phytoene/squalene synthase family protein [candidate division WOR-3 bacterium]|nr:phytoene/squalene synthase family protein [candidate division WOR-3 bacterium]